MKKSILVVGGGLLITVAASVSAADKQKPYPQYWMSVSTVNQSMPGMSTEMSGLAGMFGGKSMFGPRRELLLQLVSPDPAAGEAKADHFIPPGQKMGPSLPLVSPQQARAAVSGERDERPEQYEKPRARLLIYWGCGDTIRKGQPRVIDTATMSMADFGRAFAGRSPTRQYPPGPRKGWIYAEWPEHREKPQEIPADSSLLGVHKVGGSYLPRSLQFTLDKKRDFMAPVEFLPVSKGAGGAMKTEWKPVPTAIGYFATAMGHNQKTGEMIFWSVSEVPETGFGLMDYLTPGDVARYLKEKVLLPTSVTRCTVPPIFPEGEPAIMQFIAFGEEQNFVQPPKPKDPKKRWDIDWSAKVRLKSTAMVPLMETAAEDSPQEEQNNHTGDQSSGVMEEQSGNKQSPMQEIGDAVKGFLRW